MNYTGNHTIFNEQRDTLHPESREHGNRCRAAAGGRERRNNPLIL